MATTEFIIVKFADESEEVVPKLWYSNKDGHKACFWPKTNPDFMATKWAKDKSLPESGRVPGPSTNAL